MRWLILALALSVGACSSAPTDSRDAAAPTPTTSPATSAPSTPRPPAAADLISVPTGAGPVGLAVDPAGAVWVAQAGASTVSRVRAGRPDLTVTGVDVPLRLVADSAGAWVTSFGSGEVVRVDSTGRIVGRVAVGKGAEGVAAGLGSIWVVAQDAGRLVRIDPRRRAAVRRVDIGVGARLVTTGLGSVWVSQFQDGRVLRIDPRTYAVTRSAELCQGPQGLLAAASSVWVTCTKDNVLLRLDPGTMRVTTRVPMPEAPDGITAGPAGRIEVVSQAGPTLVTVDAASGAVRSTQSLGEQPQLYDQANLDVAVAPDGVWVSSFADNTLRRIGTSPS